jgi:mannose-6-phosphate isomerase-like protein (cupin superfamily)
MDHPLRASAFVVAEWRDRGETSAERPVAPLHVHRRDDEAWYVLEGRLGFRIGEAVLEAGVGEAVLAPKGVAHTYWNAGTGPARYLVVMTPRLAALIEELHEPGADARAVFARHDSELLV